MTAAYSKSEHMLHDGIGAICIANLTCYGGGGGGSTQNLCEERIDKPNFHAYIVRHATLNIVN